MKMDKKDIKIKIKLGYVLDAPLTNAWDYICDKYGINEWCIKEGLAGVDDEIEISLEDLEYIGWI